MKIIKTGLTEDLKNILLEDNEEVLGDTDLKTDSVSEIADAIQASVEQDSPDGATLTDASAKQIASEMQQTAKEVDAGVGEISLSKDDYNAIAAKNRITDALDKSYAIAKKAMARGKEIGANLLIEGLPGSGKTAIVKNWCQRNGLHLVSINAGDLKLDTAVNGIPLRDTIGDEGKNGEELSKNTAKAAVMGLTRVYSDEFADLMDPRYAGKCVLFVDEYNRQSNPGLRRVFLSLFCEKRNATGTLDFSKNLLFSVICINPSGPEFRDPGAASLNQAEKTRFSKYLKVDSTPDESLNYFNFVFNSDLYDLGIFPPKSPAAKEYGKSGPQRPLSKEELEQVDDILKTHDIATFILSHPDFNFDDRNSYASVIDEDKMILNARKFTDLVAGNNGDKEAILADLPESGLSSEKINMLEVILDEYILDLPGLRRSIGIVRDEEDMLDDETIDDSEPAEEEEPDDTIEDDEEDSLGIFLTNSTGRYSKTPQDAINAMKDFVDQF